MTPEYEQEVVSYIETTQAALTKAAAAVADADALRAKVAELQKVVDASAARQKQAEALYDKAFEALVKHNRTSPALREKAAAAFRDPVEAVELIARLADPGAGVPTAPRPLGGVGRAKDAAARVPAAEGERGFRMMGARSEDGARESDHAWFDALANNGSVAGVG